MQVGRGFEVRAPDHVGDALQRVVHHDREMIARRDLLAHDDRVAPALRTGRDRAPCCALGPNRTKPCGPGAAAAPAAMSMRQACGSPPAIRRSRLVRAQAAAGAGIERRAVGIARPPGGPSARPATAAAMSPPRAEAGIEEPASLQPRAAARVVVEVLGLPAHRPLPGSPSQARSSLDGVPRTRAGSEACRCPRCAAGSDRRSAGRGRRSGEPNRRGPDAAGRSGSGRSGRRVGSRERKRARERRPPRGRRS